MQIKPDEITSILKSRIEGLDAGRRRVRPGSWATVAAAAVGNSAGSFAVTIAVTGDGPVSRPSPVHGTLVARAA